MAGAVADESAVGVPGSIVGGTGIEGVALVDFFFFVVESPFDFEALDLLFFVTELVLAVASPLIEL